MGSRISATSLAYFVYLLRCADGTFYVGHTSDLKARVAAHGAGRRPRYTAARLPLELVYSEPCASLAAAIKREAQIKRWSGQKKAALAERDATELHMLSRRRR
jgi:predicted GIY-YIG superfamily endonuclease